MLVRLLSSEFDNKTVKRGTLSLFILCVCELISEYSVGRLRGRLNNRTAVGHPDGTLCTSVVTGLGLLQSLTDHKPLKCEQCNFV
jgi:hypothetical protein